MTAHRFVLGGAKRVFVQTDETTRAARGRRIEQSEERPVNDRGQLTIETITPEIAAEMLQHNKGNRSLRQNRVADYSRDMAAGRWKLTGDPIVFDSNGMLIQGQHRLHACVRAAVPFVTAVLRNADPEIFAVLDSGLSRKNNDMLRHEGVTSAKDVGAIATLVMKYERALAANQHWIQPERISPIDLLQFVRQHQSQFEAAALVGQHLKKQVHANVSASGAFHFLVTRKADAQDEPFRTSTSLSLELFIDGIASGAGLEPVDPRLHYRNWYYRPQRRRDQKFAFEAFQTMIKCWNAYIADQPMRQLKEWRSSTGLLEVQVVGGQP